MLRAGTRDYIIYPPLCIVPRYVTGYVHSFRKVASWLQFSNASDRILYMKSRVVASAALFFLAQEYMMCLF